MNSKSQIESSLGDVTKFVDDAISTVSSIGATVASAVGSASMLMDPATEERAFAGDRVEEEVKSNTAITTQEATVENVITQIKPTINLETSNMDCSGSQTNITDRWIKITTVPWSINDPIYKIIGKGVEYPNDILKKNTVFKSFTNFFAYFHCDIEIMIMMTATKFHQGAIAVCYAADDGVNSDTWKASSSRYRNIRMVPHTILNVQNGTSGKFTVPYNNKTALFDREQTHPRGRIFVIPWARLHAANGANSTLPIQIFASLKNLKVYGMTKEKSPFTTVEFQRARDMFMKGVLKLEEAGTDVTVMKSMIKSIATSFPEAFTEGVTTINVGAHCFNTANVSQSETFVQELSFLGEKKITTDHVVSSKPITYKDLLNVPVPIKDFNWSKTQSAGTILWQSVIGPNNFDGNRRRTIKPATTNWKAYEELEVEETMIDHIAKFARFWRGSLKFTFEFFNAGLQKGRVKIGLLFGERTYTSENSCYFITHDLGLEDKCEIVVPYNAWRDWMQLPSISQSFTRVGGITKKWAPVYDKAMTLGVIGVEVLNVLTTNSTMSNDIDVKVSVSSDNLELCWPQFNSRHYDYVDIGETGVMWNGQGRGIIVDSSTTASTYPQRTPYLLGDVPHLGIKTESFVGSFASQSDITSSQPTLPTTCPFKTSYIGNHIEIKSLMTRPALAAHGTFWVVQGDPALKGNNTFSVPGEDGIVIIEPDNTGIAELGIKKQHRTNWPWNHHIIPQGHQQEVCRVGTYWSGSAKLHLAISDLTYDNIKFDTAKKEASYERKGSGSGPLIFVTFSDEQCLTTKDMLMNGAYCMNVAQQKMATFNVPYYMIESQKRLSDSDLKFRIFVCTRNEIRFDLHMWISWGEDFELYFPTLMPTRRWFGGTQANGVPGRSWYYYPEQPSNWNAFPAGPAKNVLKTIVEEKEEDPPNVVAKEEKPQGNYPFKMPKFRCSCSSEDAWNGECHMCHTKTVVSQIFHLCPDCMKIVAKNLDKVDGPDLALSGDIESNPGPTDFSKSNEDILIDLNAPLSFKVPIRVKELLMKKLRNVRSSEITLNDLVGQFTSHDIKYVSKKVDTLCGQVIEVACRLSVYHHGTLVYYGSVLFCGKSESGIHKILRKRVTDKWLKHMRVMEPIFFDMLDEMVEQSYLPGEDFRAEGLGSYTIATIESIVNKLTSVAASIGVTVQFVTNAKEYMEDCKCRLFMFMSKFMLNIANLVMNPSRKNIGFVMANVTLDLLSLPGVTQKMVDVLKVSFEKMYEYIASCATPASTDTAMLSGLDALPRVENGVTEGLMDSAGFISGIVGALGLLITAVFGVVTKSSDIARMTMDVVKTMKNVTSIVSGIKGIAWIVDQFWKAFDGVLGYFKDGFTVEERSSKWFMAHKDEILTWEMEIHLMEEEYQKEKACMDHRMKANIRKLFAFGQVIHTECLMSKETVGLFGKLRMNWNLVSRWHQDMLRMDGCFKTRPEPVVTYLYGDAGQGKSLLSTILAGEMAVFFGDDQDNFYSLPPGFKYMDNYAQQSTMIIDDIGQGSDDEDWKVFCQMISTTPFIPPMASLTDKGLVFTTPYVICTSNIVDPDPTTIHDHDALNRRLWQKVRVTAKPAYRKDGKLDVSKAIADGKLYDGSCFVLTITDDWQSERGITFEALKQSVKEECVKRMSNVKKLAKDRPVIDEKTYDEMMEEAMTEGWFSMEEKAEYDGPPFIQCEECCGVHMCKICEPLMRARDGISVTDWPKLIKYAVKMTLPEYKLLVDEIHPDIMKNISIGMYEAAYQIAIDKGRRHQYYTALDLMKIAVMYDLFEHEKYRWKNERLIRFGTMWSTAVAVILQILTVIVFIKIARQGVNWWLGEPEAYQDGAPRKAMKPAKMVKAKVQAVKTEGNVDLIEEHISKNQEFVTFYADDVRCASGMVLFLDGTTILTAKHLLMMPESSDKITHMRIKQGLRFLDLPIADNCITDISIEETMVDMVVITLPNPFGGKRKIHHLFVTQEQLPHTEKYGVHLLSKKFDTRRIVEARRPYIYHDKGKYTGQYGDVYEYASIIRYNMTDRGPGDSGGVVTTSSPHCEGRVLGLHVAGNGSYGMALPLTTELVAELVMCANRGEKFIENIEPPPELDEASETVNMLPNTSEKVPVLKELEVGVTIATKTDIKKSELFGKILPVLRGPAALAPNDKRVLEENAGDPVWNMPKKFNKDTGYVNQEYLEKAIEHCANIVICNSTEEKKGVLSMFEAVNGMGKGETMEQIPLATSPGYPYSQQKGASKGKKGFLNKIGEDKEGREFYAPKEELMERIQEREEKAKNRERIAGSYFQTALKNELRPHSKIEANGARTIECCPLDYFLLFRQYVGSFTNWMTKNYGTLTGSCVGCNPDLDWTLFYLELKEVSDDMIAVDFTNWDGTIPCQYLYASVRIINEYYLAIAERQMEGKNAYEQQKIWDEVKEANNVRDVLFDELALTISIVKKWLIATFNGLPSGHPMTALLNCLIHWLKMNVAYLEATRSRPDLHSLVVYERNHKSLFYGDDGITAISSKIRDVFTRFDLASTSTKEGMLCTMEDKDSVMTAFSKMSDVSYLKRKFQKNEKDGKIINAPIEMRTIGSLLNFVRTNGTLEQNVEDAMWFLYHHGESVYEPIRKKVVMEMGKIDRAIVLPTWKQQYANHLTKFGMLPTEWRTRPIIPEITVLLSRARLNNRSLTQKLDQYGYKTSEWSPYLTIFSKEHLCDCGEIVYAKIEGVCFKCLGVKNIPEWYFFKDRTIEDCVRIEQHHMLTKTSWRPDHVNGTCSGGKEIYHHTCRGCNEVVLHLSVCKSGRRCLPCLGIEVPDWYSLGKLNKALLLLAGDVETNPGPTVIEIFVLEFLKTMIMRIIFEATYGFINSRLSAHEQRDMAYVKALFELALKMYHIHNIMFSIVIPIHCKMKLIIDRQAFFLHYLWVVFERGRMVQ